MSSSVRTTRGRKVEGSVCLGGRRGSVKSERPVRTLLVEDNPTDALLLQEKLRDLSTTQFVVTCADRLEHALCLLTKSEFDVVLLDLGLPDSSGTDTLEELRRRQPEVPVVVLTGLDDELTGTRALQLGAQDFLVKGQIPASMLGRSLRYAIERHHSALALRQSQARELARATELQAIMDVVPVALMIARDAECRDVIGNRKTYDLLRMPEGGNISQSGAGGNKAMSFRMTRNGADIALEDQPVQLAARTGQPQFECEFDLQFPDGTERRLFGNAVPLFDGQEKARGAVGAFVDVTERKMAEQRLQHTQRLESIGLLAGGIAHDFNNILTAVRGTISLVLADLCPTCEVKSMLEVGVEAVDRAAGLTRQLLAYAGKGAFTRAPVSCSQVAEKAVQLARGALSGKVQLRTDLAWDLPPVIMDPTQLEQIFLNLILNGIEAIREGQGGVVTVSTSFSNGFVRVAVSDTGSGMDEATQKRMFEPFFSTKFTGRGLGLAAVDGIVRSLNGRISVDSAVGKGTRIQVLLPAVNCADTATAVSMVATGSA